MRISVIESEFEWRCKMIKEITCTYGNIFKCTGERLVSYEIPGSKIGIDITGRDIPEDVRGYKCDKCQKITPI